MIKFILIFLFSLNLFANNALDVLKRHDVSFYTPKLLGLKDLVVDVEIEGLTKMLNDSLIYGRLTKVYFTVYWHIEKGLFVEVNGMPKGFGERKAQLSTMVINRFDLIIPKTLESQFKNFNLKTRKGAQQSTIITAANPADTDINLITIKIDRNSRLESIELERPIGKESSTFSVNKQKWSNGKWVLNGMVQRIVHGTQAIKVDNKITYGTFSGVGLPVKFFSETTQTPIQPGHLDRGKKEKYSRTVSQVINFTNYRVNKGLALKKLRGKSK